MEIKVYEVKEGDTIIFRFPLSMTYDAIAKLSENIRAGLPEGIKAIVIDEQPEIMIIKKVHECK